MDHTGQSIQDWIKYKVKSPSKDKYRNLSFYRLLVFLGLKMNILKTIFITVKINTIDCVQLSMF